MKVNSLVTVFNRPGVIVGEHAPYVWIVEFKDEAGRIVRARIDKRVVKERK